MVKKIWSGMLMIALLLGLCACAANPDPTAAGDLGQQEQTDGSPVIADEIADLEQETDPEPEADPESAAVVDVIFTRYEETLHEHAVINGVDAQGNVCWNYTTPIYELTQLPGIVEIGIYNHMYYFNDRGTITTLDLQSGQVIWRSEGGGVGVSEEAYAFGADGTLYYCGYLGPDFCAIGADGTILKTINELYADFYWPYRIRVDGGMAFITFEDGPDDPVWLDLQDWSYGIYE